MFRSLFRKVVGSLGVAVLFLLVSWTGVGASQPTQDVEDSSITAEQSGPSMGALSIDDCVKKILVESPYMKMHDLSIEIKGLDADDAWYQMFPKIDLALSSNTPVGGKNHNKSSFSVTLSSGGYDPISASLSHDAQLKLTALAQYAKLKSASDLLLNVVSLYIREASFSKNMAYYDQLLEKAKELYAFSVKTHPDSPKVPLDVKLAEHKIKQIQLQKQQLVNRRTRELIRLKRILGMPAEQRLELAVIDVDEVVFRHDDPSKMTFEEVKRNSLTEKMAAIGVELAEHNILAAWAKYVPKFSFNVRAPDPVNNGRSDDSYYFTVGVVAPLWHWGEMSRGRERARLQKQRTLLQNTAEMHSWEDQWILHCTTYREQLDRQNLAVAELAMREIQVRKNKILFNTGGVTYAQLTQTEMAEIRREIDAVNGREAVLLSKLNLFFESGKLLDRFVQVEDVENEEE